MVVGGWNVGNDNKDDDYYHLWVQLIIDINEQGKELEREEEDDIVPESNHI